MESPHQQSSTLIGQFTGFLVILVGLFLAVNALLCQIPIIKSDDSHWTDHIGSKARQLSILSQHTSFQHVLLGSSRTAFHIDSALIKKMTGQNVYNFGMNTINAEHLMTLLHSDGHLRDSKLYFSIDPSYLIDATFKYYYPLTLQDVGALCHANPRECFGYAKQYMIDWNKFKLFSGSIRTILSGIHERMILGTPATKGSTESPMFAQHKYLCPSNITLPHDHGKILEVRCQNGDGYIAKLAPDSSFKPVVGVEYKSDLKPNLVKMRYLNEIWQTAKSQGFDLTLILEPTYEPMPVGFIKEIKKNFHDPLVDLNTVRIPATFWVDREHFDHRGRIAYTQKLIKALQLNPREISLLSPSDGDAN